MVLKKILNLDIIIISEFDIIVNEMNRKYIFTTKWIAYTALMTALVIATSFITPLPIPPLGNLYWCDGVIFIAAYLLDPLAAFIAGGIGTFLYDIIHGNAAMMFPSLVIHGLQAAATSALVYFVFSKFPKKSQPAFTVLASLAGGAIVVAGYFAYRMIIGNTLQVAGYKAVANLIQEAVGISIAMVICYGLTLKEQLERYRLLPDFKREVKGIEPTEDVQTERNDEE